MLLKICGAIKGQYVVPHNCILLVILTHCGRVTQICVFNMGKLGTSASSPQYHSTRANVSRGITPSSTTRVFGEYFMKISVHKNSQRICYKFLKKHSTYLINPQATNDARTHAHTRARAHTHTHTHTEHPQAARLLRLWVRIPPWAWICVCCECCVLSGRGLCDELITRPEESYRLWCVVVCDLETLRMRRP